VSGRRDLRAFSVSDEQCQRPIEENGDVAIRHDMSQEFLRVPELFECLAAHGELDLVGFRRQRLDLGVSRRDLCGWQRRCVVSHVRRFDAVRQSAWLDQRRARQRVLFESGWLRSRQLSHRGWNGRLWSQCRDDFLDVAFGLVCRCGQNRLVVLDRQMRREEPHACQVHQAVSEESENRWKPTHSARGFDPSVGFVLREVQYLRAICEERRAALVEIKTAGVDFSERRDELRGRRALPGNERFHRDQQIAVGQRCGGGHVV
jgi:hypothetical protein